MRHWWITAIVMVALVPCGWAQNYDDYTQPYDADASTPFLWDYNEHEYLGVDDPANPYIAPNGAPDSLLWMQCWFLAEGDPDSIRYNEDVPAPAFGQSGYYSGDEDWPRTDWIVWTGYGGWPTEGGWASDQELLDSFGFGTAVTMEAWVKPMGGVDGIRRFLCAAGVYHLSLYEGEFDFWVNTTGASDAVYVATTDVDVQVDTWYHVAGTYDGQTAAIWVNGEMVASETLPEPEAPDVPTTGTWWTAGAAPWPNENFQGFVDEVRVSTVARWDAGAEGEPEPEGEPLEGGPVTEGAPVAGMLGLGLIAAACAFAGAVVLKRKQA